MKRSAIAEKMAALETEAFEALRVAVNSVNDAALLLAWDDWLLLRNAGTAAPTVSPIPTPQTAPQTAAKGTRNVRTLPTVPMVPESSNGDCTATERHALDHLKKMREEVSSRVLKITLDIPNVNFSLARLVALGAIKKNPKRSRTGYSFVFEPFDSKGKLLGRRAPD